MRPLDGFIPIFEGLVSVFRRFLVCFEMVGGAADYGGEFVSPDILFGAHGAYVEWSEAACFVRTDLSIAG